MIFDKDMTSAKVNEKNLVMIIKKLLSKNFPIVLNIHPEIRELSHSRNPQTTLKF